MKLRDTKTCVGKGNDQTLDYVYHSAVRMQDEVRETEETSAAALSALPTVACPPRKVGTLATSDSGPDVQVHIQHLMAVKSNTTHWLSWIWPDCEPPI